MDQAHKPGKERETGGEDKRSGTIQSITTAVRFLDILVNASSAMPLGELARHVGVGRSTAHRYLQSLVKEGMIQQDNVSGYYDLGPKALSIGIGALRRVDAIEIAARHMQQLALNHAMSGGVAIWTERGPTLVRWYRSAYFSINPLGLGDVLPVDNTACGLVFQAFMPATRIDMARRNQPEHFRGTPPSRKVLQKIRQDAWAELTSHLLSDVTGQAAPVLDAQQEIVCVMTTVADLGRLHAPDDRELLLREAMQVNEATGGRLR